jgi:SAM-dependent methyltransferase
VIHQRSLVEGPTESGNRASSFEFLTCSQCKNSDWSLEGKTLLRCQFCQRSLAIEGNIVDCLGDDATNNWNIEAWDKQYGKREESYSPDDDWWRLASWQKHLFGPMLGNLAGRTVIDFGCGTADRVTALAPAGDCGYSYAGVDSSIKALRRAAANQPGGVFVRTNLGPFVPRPASADAILCLGVLMYFPNYAEVFERFMSALKPGGILLLHELIQRKSWRRAAGPFYRPEQTFPDPCGLPWPELREHLASRGKILHEHLAASAFRRPLSYFPEVVHLKSLRRVAIGLDSLWCSTVGRILPAIGGSEVQIIFQKN